MKEMDAGAILRFGIEADLIKILQDPVTSMACDCGASTATRVHPRFYGSYPRVLGRYVREQGIMTWEQAIRKSSALPAATIGMVDRGLVAVGMRADITVFDPATVIDRATYESPAQPSEGIRHVFVNGVLALRDGAATGARAGRALTRTANMPSRPTTEPVARRVSARGLVAGATIALDVAQAVGARQATGTLTLSDPRTETSIALTGIGVLQVHGEWASFSGLVRMQLGGDERAVMVIVDAADPASPDAAVVVVHVDGSAPWRGMLPRRAVSVR